ncbi:hypothetical protein N7540_000833 [Penicillium herquei]|nr:hypothetical protein N7540_000833 [Penicillium herquei]
MASEQRGAYCTLLLSDNYLPGAMVLAHSLRDNGTTAKLIALFTPDKLRSETVNELRTVYDELIPVHSITNATPANLWLMDRPDLIATFTKIELWRLTQYERIIYIDCDVVAIRAPDELFALDVDFAAAPDVGWPDCFNSGLMALRPNMEDYYALKALAERGISFDGADQGLLNMHFRDWHRLSFTYNCTPSANYQYIPAYKHFQSTISLIHFIGSQKPWNMPRQVVPLDSPYNQLLGIWWSVYDRHYRPPFVTYSQPDHLQPSYGPDHHTETTHSAGQEFNQAHYEQQPESQHSHHQDEPVSSHHEGAHSEEEIPTLVSSETAHARQDSWHQPHQEFHEHHQHQEHHEHQDYHEHPHHHHHHETHHHEPHHVSNITNVPVLSAVPQYVRGEEHVSAFIPPMPYAPAPETHVHHPTYGTQPDTNHPHYQHHQHQHHDHHQHYHQEQQPQQQQQQQQQHDQPHEHSENPIHHPQPGAPPVTEHWHRPPSPEPEAEPGTPSFQAPQAEWDASREPPPLNTRPEGISLEQKTYTMSEDTKLFQPPPSYPEPPKNMYYEVPETKPEPQRVMQVFPWESHAPQPTRVFADEQPVLRAQSPEQAPDQPSWQSAEEPVPVEQSDNESFFQFRMPYEPSAETWDQYTRSNAWDEDPHIQRYIESLQQARRGKTQVISGSAHASPSHSTNTSTSTSYFSSTTATTTGTSSGHRPSIRLTDFPSEIERPSLPVTPAPIERSRGPMSDEHEGSTVTTLPVAEGVPNQEDWNPLARLEELRRRQSAALEDPELLFRKLSEAWRSDL